MPANLVFLRKIWGARDNGIPPRSTPDEEGIERCGWMKLKRSTDHNSEEKIYNSVCTRRHTHINSSASAPLKATKIAVMNVSHLGVTVVGSE